jgi:hypothetical protein
MPPVDHRFKVLEILYERQPQEVNLRQFFMPIIENGQMIREGLSSILTKLRTDGFIWTGDLISLSHSRNGVYDDRPPILAKLEYRGIDEYLRLKEQYSPKPVGNSIQIGGNVVGNISQGNQGPVTQSINDENPETVKLAKKSVKIGKWTLIWTAVGVVVAILIAVLATYGHGAK